MTIIGASVSLGVHVPNAPYVNPSALARQGGDVVAAWGVTDHKDLERLAACPHVACFVAETSNRLGVFGAFRDPDSGPDLIVPEINGGFGMAQPPLFIADDL